MGEECSASCRNLSNDKLCNFVSCKSKCLNFERSVIALLATVTMYKLS
jgi:hypothetical protein